MKNPRDWFAVKPDRIQTCIGLISDTHLPDRLSRLPEVLFEVFRGVDLLLHAGDVGELRVLDELSTIAPVIAVHGNDDTSDAYQQLAEKQVVVAGGKRIVLFHSHYSDHEQEMAARKADDWQSKLDYRAQITKQAGGVIGVFGHTHIPMSALHDDILLINPGALASGNHATRQTHRTVALLAILDGGNPLSVHIDLAHPDQLFDVNHDLSQGFIRVSRKFTASILEPHLRDRFPALKPIIEQAWEPSLCAIRRAAYRCWDGTQEMITAEDILVEMRSEPDIPLSVLSEIESVLS